jgi:hypothetical protein
LKSLGLRNKHIVHHRAQKLHGEKVELHDDKEFLQIYLNELLMGVLSDLLQSAEYFQKTRPWLLAYLEQVEARDVQLLHLTVRRWHLKPMRVTSRPRIRSAWLAPIGLSCTKNVQLRGICRSIFGKELD